MVPKDEVTPTRFLRVRSGYLITAALCQTIGGLPEIGVAGMSDARGLSQHDRASLYHNPRRGKSLSGEKGKDQNLLYPVITGNSRRLGEREQRVPMLVSCHECRGT